MTKFTFCSASARCWLDKLLRALLPTFSTLCETDLANFLMFFFSFWPRLMREPPMLPTALLTGRELVKEWVAKSYFLQILHIWPILLDKVTQPISLSQKFRIWIGIFSIIHQFLPLFIIAVNVQSNFWDKIPVFWQNTYIKFWYSEKATKFEKNLPLVLTFTK